MRFKYIVSEYGTFALFSETEIHADIARGMAGKIVGAGFASIGIGYYTDKETEEERTMLNVHCFGESISLGINGNKQHDENIINKKLNHH